MNELSASIQRWLEKNLQFIDFVIPIEDSLTSDPVQAMFCGSIPRMQQALATLSASNLDEDITVLRTEYAARDLSMVDVLNQGCSKGHALERWADHRGIPREEVMAIGDNYNDIEMLAFAGVPFIMGNAAEELRRDGWTVTLSNDQNGVAAAIEQVLGIFVAPPSRRLSMGPATARVPSGQPARRRRYNSSQHDSIEKTRVCAGTAASRPTGSGHRPRHPA